MPYSDSDKRSALDQVFRDYLLQLLAEPCENVSIWENYVTFCIETCRQDMCTPTMPFVLLGDIFDALTLERCETLFAFVENGVNTWREEMFFSACKNNLLRMCNGKMDINTICFLKALMMLYFLVILVLLGFWRIYIM